jgi:hypothetical protein
MTNLELCVLDFALSAEAALAILDGHIGEHSGTNQTNGSFLRQRSETCRSPSGQSRSVIGTLSRDPGPCSVSPVIIVNLVSRQIAGGSTATGHSAEKETSMNAANEEVRILTVASCSNVRAEHRLHVVVSGSYGGRYNAFNAAKWPVRAVIMNDAGIGKDKAGIVGLDFLDQIDMAAATADARTCHIGDGDHMLAHGIISHVNRAAAALGCAPGQSVRNCAERMRAATVPTATPPPITEGARFVMRDVPGEPVLICADSIGMLQPDDAGRIVVTASHGALSGGRPDNTVPLAIYAVFFSDAGCGMDRAGVARLDDLDQKGIVAGAISADSAPIGDSCALYHDGILSHVNGPASLRGGRIGMKLNDFIEVLIAAAK